METRCNVIEPVNQRRGRNCGSWPGGELGIINVIGIICHYILTSGGVTHSKVFLHFDCVEGRAALRCEFIQT